MQHKKQIVGIINSIKDRVTNSNRILGFGLLLMVIVYTSSCSSHKKAIKTDKPVAEKKKDLVDPQKKIIADKLAINRNEPQYFAAKLDIECADNYFVMRNFTANIRMHKDKAIWVSVSANLGLKIEVGKALITPDSITVIDKYNRTYYAKPFNYINSFLKYPLDFATLQQLLWGNSPSCSGVLSYETVGDLFKVKTETEYVWIDNKDYLLRNLLLNEPSSNKSLEVAYREFEPFESSYISTNRTFKFNIPQLYQFDIDFTKIDTDGPFEMPFEYAKYKKVD